MNIYFYIIIVLVTVEFALTKYLSYLNIGYFGRKVPDNVSDVYDEEKYKKSVQYDKTKAKFWLLVSTVSFWVMFAFLVFWVFWYLSDFIGTYSQNPIVWGLLFFWVLMLFQTLAGIPSSYYSTFVIEEKFWFNKMTKKLFVLDTIKWLLLSAALGAAVLSLIIWLYSYFWDRFWLYAWALVTTLSIFMMMFYSSVIVPIFNKQTPLEQGELRTAIEDFWKKVGFKIDNIFVIDGSKRSTKSNAYFAGIGPKKRIVLYDTLIADLTTQELVAVLAHEIWHYKRKHTFQMLAFSVIQTGFIFFILWKALSIPEISYALGTSNANFHLGVIAFGILFTPISIILWIFGNILSRKNEYEADAYAKEHYNSDKLVSALKKLSKNNLSNLTPHPAYEFFHYSHPNISKRISALEAKK